MPVSKLTVDAALFDLDGTLIISTQAVESAWKHLHKQHNMEVDPEFFHVTHGFRTVDSFKKYFPQIDDKDGALSAEFERFISSEFHHLATPVKGGAKLVNDMPQDRWCIVTSGTRDLLHSWFDYVLLESGLPKPKVFITSNDVQNGKPNPEPYLTGLKGLLLPKSDTAPRTVVFEDAPTGIKAGVSSGAVVIGIATAFEPEILKKSGATYVVQDLTHVKVTEKAADGSFTLEIDHIDN